MSKKQLAKFIADQVDEFLKKGGKVKKVPEGKAKGVDDKTEAKPKNLPRDRQGKTIKFDADERSRQNINFKEGGLILRVTNRGPLYKGKKSGNKNS